MKLATFIQEFDLFADAPDAVGKMRELVLESQLAASSATAKNLLEALVAEPTTA